MYSPDHQVEPRLSQLAKEIIVNISVMLKYNVNEVIIIGTYQACQHVNLLNIVVLPRSSFL